MTAASAAIDRTVIRSDSHCWLCKSIRNETMRRKFRATEGVAEDQRVL